MDLVEPIGQVQARLEPREAVGDLNVRILIFSLSSAAAFLPRPGCLHEATENLMVAVMVYQRNWINLTSYNNYYNSAESINMVITLQIFPQIELILTW